MSDLTDFLLARIAEDEERARAAMQRGLLPGDGPARWRDEDRGGNPGHSVVWNGVGQAVVSHAYHHQGAHIARHDPARVVAECEAKRRILEWHRPSTDHGEGFLPYCLGCWEDAGMDGAPTYPCRTLRYLAAPHADHPDYRQEWKP